MTKPQADKWIRFLRSYGPITINENMYAENITKLSAAYGIPELRFQHPLQSEIFGSVDPANGSITNVVLTGTAGEGKTWLCYRLWEKFGGDVSELDEGLSYRPMIVQSPTGPVTIHFIFDLSGLAPEKEQAWVPERLDLLKNFVASLAGHGSEYFVVACNDGKLVHICQRLTQECPDASLTQMRSDFDELLATNKRTLPGRRLLFLNMSCVRSVDLFQLAVDALFTRPEWECFDSLKDDPAFGSESPLRKNFLLLKGSSVLIASARPAGTLRCQRLPYSHQGNAHVVGQWPLGPSKGQSAGDERCRYSQNREREDGSFGCHPSKCLR